MTVARLDSVPRATYRLQFSPRFTFAQAREIVPYLAALGVSHVYASPFLKARPGSEHGYDIVDHTAINPEIGGWDGFVAFSDALGLHGLGLILDFVPNHMGIGKVDNAWWLDVLEWGQGSRYADFFDIDWNPFKPELKGKLLLPLLGDHYGNVLARGELVLRFAADEGSLSVWYHDHRLPLRPRNYAAVLRRQLARRVGDGLSDETRAQLVRLAYDFDRVRRVARRRREEAHQRSAELKTELATLCRSNAAAARFMAEAADAFNGMPGEPETFRALHGLIERQHYRPAYWRVAADEINYRRFFNINELAGIRIEERALFDLAHALVGRSPREGCTDCASTMSTACSTPRATAGACRPSRASACRAVPTATARRSTSWWRRSSPITKRCARAGRSPARPATNSRRSPTDFSSIRRRRRGSTQSTATSSAKFPRSTTCSSRPRTR